MSNHEQFGQTWMTAFSSDLRPEHSNALEDMGRRPPTRRRRDSMPTRLTAPSLRLGPLSAPSTVKVQPRHARLRVHHQVRGTRHVLTQELFRDVLLREQKCTQRFEQRLVLLLVRADSRSAIASQSWAKVIDALSIAAGDTAVVGWLDTQSVLGAVLPEIRGCDPEALLRRELARHLEAENVARLSIRTHIYTHENALQLNAAGPADPVRDEPPSSRGSRVRTAARLEIGRAHV